MKIAFFKPPYLFIAPQSVLRLVVCSVCNWFLIYSVPYFLYPSLYGFFFYHLLTMFFSVHTCISLCHKFRICVFIYSNFINLFNDFICKYFIIAIGIAVRCITFLFVKLWSATVSNIIENN